VTDPKQPLSFIKWIWGVLCLAGVARIGWELGGKLWSLLL